MGITKRELQILQQQKEQDKFEPYRELPRGEVQEVDGSIEGDLSYLVWVRQLETNGGIVQMFNPGLTLEAGMTVFYAPDPRKPAPWTILGFDQSTYLGDAATLLTLANTGLVNHALNHELRPGLPGSDPLNIYSHALVDFACRPTSPVSMRVNIYSGWYPGDSTYQFFRGPVASKDFTSDVPGSSGQALIEAITIDNTGTFQYYTGTAYTDGDPVPSSAWPSVPIDELLITAIRLVNGMSSIQNENFDQEMRPVFGPGGFAGARKITELWESDFGAVAAEANAGGDVVFNNNIYMASGKFATGDAYGFIVKNTSGATASPGDVGYLDDSSEYKTTTTGGDDQPKPVLVLIGAANNSDIYVTRGPGRGTMNYTGSAPSSGDYLEFSATAGSVQTNGTDFHPGIVAQARAAGSGGTVSVDLLLRTIFWPKTYSQDIYRTASSNVSDSDFVATIDSLPGGAAVRYDTPSSGSEDNLEPLATDQLAKLTLHNTTRGNSALISDNDPGGGAGYDGEITLTDTVPGDWQVGDTITLQSQTNTHTVGSSYFADFDMSESSDIPVLARAMACILLWQDTALSGERLFLHPFEANSTPKTVSLRNYVSGLNITLDTSVPLIRQRFCLLWQASGSGTGFLIVRSKGFWVAA